ncbi:hypothetical protein EDC96DRAFT_513051 [Choanephora cucurbitarum]|nr:hypothetical protein EDC96DRAFT_513051 [Choanephora cucurbitarum]
MYVFLLVKSCTDLFAYHQFLSLLFSGISITIIFLLLYIFNRSLCYDHSSLKSLLFFTSVFSQPSLLIYFLLAAICIRVSLFLFIQSLLIHFL